MVKMTVLGSKKHMCINPKVQNEKDRNESCKKLLDTPGGCGFYGGRKAMEKIRHYPEFGMGQVFDIEDLVNSIFIHKIIIKCLKFIK